jgi:fatty-acyl-CoA synthase
VFSSLLKVPTQGHKISSLKYALCGAAPMPIGVFKKFEESTGVKILEGYGLTEATCVSSVNPPKGERRIGSIGLHILHQQMKVVILNEQGEYVRDCETGEVGVLVMTGPNVFLGYRNSQ